MGKIDGEMDDSWNGSMVATFQSFKPILRWRKVSLMMRPRCKAQNYGLLGNVGVENIETPIFGWQKPWFSWFPVEMLLKPIHCDLTFLVASDGPLFSGRDGKERSGDGWRRRILMGLDGSETGVPNGYLNGEND